MINAIKNSNVGSGAESDARGGYFRWNGQTKTLSKEAIFR